MYVLESTDELGRRLVFPLIKTRTIIGRDSSCDIVLDDEDVSRQHAKVYLIEGRVQIKDMGSLNGTHVNNIQIDKMTVLKLGSEIIIGSNQFYLRDEVATEEEVSLTTMLTQNQLKIMQDRFIPEKFDENQEVEPIPIEDEELDDNEPSETISMDRQQLMAAIYQKKIDFASYPALEVIFGQDKGKKYILRPGIYILGRQEGLKIRLDDQKVSSRHAKIEKTEPGWMFSDLGSTNGSIINAKLTQHALLNHGDVLMLGNTKIKFVDHSSMKRKAAETSRQQPQLVKIPPVAKDSFQLWFDLHKNRIYFGLGVMLFILIVLLIYLSV